MDEDEEGVETAGGKASLLLAGDDTLEGMVGSKGVEDYNDCGSGEGRVRRWTTTWADKVGKRAAVVSEGMRGWRLASSKDLEAQCVKGGIYWAGEGGSRAQVDRSEAGERKGRPVGDCRMRRTGSMRMSSKEEYVV